MKINKITPIVGSWVKKNFNDDRGIVTGINPDISPTECSVNWLQSKRTESIPAYQLRCGFPLGIEVQDIPASRTRNSLGEGVVIETRTLGERDQVLVEFLETGERHWLPYENLRYIQGIQKRFELGQSGEPGNAERFRLRSLAYAIEMWHENTGSLSHLAIDPLPHQIHLVHHILASGNLNWMIADDVGLGKTIEVGMLLSALLRRGTHRRILLITPAGLVNQWKEELHYKFRLSDFQIYGNDFQVSEPRHWKLHDFVIGSMDRFKSEYHLENLMQAGSWDLIVFDEAHRLSRAQYGMKYESSDRFRLAASLRKKTDSLLLLTATPHQGKQDKFQALLELLRPELKSQIRTLTLNPSILREMVIRNHKADVTDASGNFIFQGKLTSSIPVNLSPIEMNFDRDLQKYLREGYEAGGRSGGIRGRAIGFVMAIYRKLAASSIAAIEQALSRRLDRLENGDLSINTTRTTDESVDERYIGEWEESQESPGGEFFEGEIPLLKNLIRQARDVFEKDNKINMFLNELIGTVLKNNPTEKILIFAEYRGTQEYIAKTLMKKFGTHSVALIHGGLRHEEREDAIAHFEEKGQFLISTEAGGEGINLQRECHIMVNYDLPWNPMRLVQRVGRLYRYGQKNKVVVFNVNVPQSLDGNILNILYQRIEQVVADMSILGGDFRPGFEAEILGELAEVLSISEILERANLETLKRTQENIDDALKRAREAVEKQRELLEFAAGYDPDETAGEMNISLDHVDAFINGLVKFLDISVLETTHKGKVMKINLPDNIAAEIGMGGNQLRITLDRDIASRRKEIQMMDLESPFFRYILAYAKDYKFDGRVAQLSKLSGQSAISAMLRWQNDQGVRMRQEFISVLVNEDGSTENNSIEFINWLMSPSVDGEFFGGPSAAKTTYQTALTAMNGRLGEISNEFLHPENIQIVSCGWCSGDLTTP